MSVKILVCRVQQEPEVVEVENAVSYGTSLGMSYVQHQSIYIGDEKLLALWDEDDLGKQPYNRPVPSKGPHVPTDVSFVIDTRKGPPESYAKPGELGFFHVRGPIIITKVDDNEGGLLSLSKEEIHTLSVLLALPKCAQCLTEPLAYPGAVYCGAACSTAAEMHLPTGPQNLKETL